MSDIFILNNIFNEDLSNTIFDFPRNGEIDRQGQIKKVYGEEAVINAIQIWIKSKKGERLRDPVGGGYITQYLTKPVNEDTQLAMQEAFIAGFQQDFEPTLTLTKLLLIPKEKAWDIQIQAYSRDLKISINVEEIIETQQ